MYFYVFLDIQKWIMDIQNRFVDILKYIFGYPKCFGYPKLFCDILNSFLDIQKWIMDILKWMFDIYT